MSAVFSSCVQLRFMQESDLITVMKIETAAYSFPWTFKNFKDCLHVGYNAKVLEVENNLSGYGVMSAAVGEAHILNLCVHPNLQGCGYGQYILKDLLVLAKQKEVNTVFLDVRRSNKSAFNLYHKMGFNQIGVRKNYYPNSNQTHEDALIFALTL
ncbi:ribosomal protein S18-alanine N-acetyltransferase [Candidatus Parabeggiatoa sp. HSG14]|uniref:ribosomal protein S18-alanine N-acetyltransferase n=1 Tax=Candidatus Parabeggiatoa sp. HSG14 TaxID=3055593 RepID=UPI0025A851D2|nr:ribosomal protein S18-alanine N-acetyltransferase [Thiotrichales bacterium HSG14]